MVLTWLRACKQVPIVSVKQLVSTQDCLGYAQGSKQSCVCMCDRLWVCLCVADQTSSSWENSSLVQRALGVNGDHDSNKLNQYLYR